MQKATVLCKRSIKYQVMRPLLWISLQVDLPVEIYNDYIRVKTDRAV